LIRQHGLREGLLISAELGNSSKPGQSAPLSKIISCNSLPFEKYASITDIKSLTSIDAEEQLKMTRGERDYTGRLIDLLTPIGKGQRGMIISPPKAGKTTILKHIAKAVLENHPEVKVMMLLVDERPEEVTDFRRDLPGAEVFYSSADQDVENHLRITTLTMNMATRRMEFGEDVLVLIDSLTRMGRAFNKDADSGGKTLSGGLAANALELPRRFFGAARNIEHGGSLTIMATILVETGSRMDEVIFQEFKGTGNLDLVLCRECAERRLFPAINIRESGTRKEHKILSPEALKESTYLRRKMAEMKAPEALELVLEALR
jgi:transcription termination factor Rho